jgi:molecular chaperone DnaK
VCLQAVVRLAPTTSCTHVPTRYYSVKRLIGRSWSDPAVQEEAQRLAYTVSWTPWCNSMPSGMRDWTHCPIMNTSAAADSDGNSVLACPHVDPGYLYPEEVSHS